MLDDPRSDALVSNFAGQWLYLRNLDVAKPDPDASPNSTTALRDVLPQGDRAVLRQRSCARTAAFSSLLDANYTFLNQRLAEHYGIQNVYGSQFRKVTLTDPNRGGILGQGSVLTVTSYPNRTSVVQRGKWILENAAGRAAAAAAARCSRFEAARQRWPAAHACASRWKQHRANPVCASCHSRMDPIGFRARELRRRRQVAHEGRRQRDRRLRQAAGRHRFRRPRRLEEASADARTATSSSIPPTEKLLIYALGRGLEYYDLPAVRGIARDAAKDNYRMSALIAAIVKSTPFQMRRTLGSMTSSRRNTLHRRMFLRGLGATLALPLLDSMVPAMAATTNAAAKPAVRMAFVYVPNGIIPAAGPPPPNRHGLRVHAHDEAARAVPRPHERCSAAWRRSTAARSATARATTRAPAPRGSPASIPRRPKARASTPASPPTRSPPSELGKSTQLASLEIGLDTPSLAGGCDSGYSCAYTNTISWRGRQHADARWSRIRAPFSSASSAMATAPTPPPRLTALKEQRSILDYIAGDIDRLETGLGKRDRSKLTEYLEAIRDIERRIQKAEEQNATMKIPVTRAPRRRSRRVRRSRQAHDRHAGHRLPGRPDPHRSPS